jgi:ketosteroid isomerase-like protein
MSETNKALARRWFEEVWNQKKVATIDELYHPDGQSKGLPDPDSVIRGPEAFKQVHRNLLSSFPDQHMSLEELVAEGDWVAVRWTASLGHSPAGKALNMNGSSFVRFQQGKIIEGWNQMDFTKLRLQMEDKA